MRQYETIYIINPDVTEEDYGEVIKKVNDLIEKQKGVIIKVEEWGKQKLAYLLKKFDKGSYVSMNYCGEPGVTQELERDLKLDDRILKYQTIKIADKVDPQELILKEKEKENEAKKESDIKAEQVLEKEEMVPVEERAQMEEVKNDV